MNKATPGWLNWKLFVIQVKLIYASFTHQISHPPSSISLIVRWARLWCPWRRCPGWPWCPPSWPPELWWPDCLTSPGSEDVSSLSKRTTEIEFPSVREWPDSESIIQREIWSLFPWKLPDLVCMIYGHSFHESDQIEWKIQIEIWSLFLYLRISPILRGRTRNWGRGTRLLNRRSRRLTENVKRSYKEMQPKRFECHTSL